MLQFLRKFAGRVIGFQTAGERRARRCSARGTGLNVTKEGAYVHCLRLRFAQYSPFGVRSQSFSMYPPGLPRINCSKNL